MVNRKKLYLYLGLLLSKGIGYSLYYDIIKNFKELEELDSVAGKRKLKELIKYKMIKNIPEINISVITGLVEKEISNCKTEEIEIILQYCVIILSLLNRAIYCHFDYCYNI